MRFAKPRIRILVLVALFTTCVEAGADLGRPLLVLRLGLSGAPEADADRGATLDYLAQLARDTETDERFAGSLEFDISEGNAYQLLSWLRRGDLDAAVVSSFVATLVEDSGVARRVLEVAPPGNDSCRGTSPRIAARQSSAWLADPVPAYRRFIRKLYHDSSARAIDDRSNASSETAQDGGLEPSMVHLVFESHLSSSGFIAPVLLAHEQVQQALQSLGREQRGAVAESFWGSFFASARFQAIASENPMRSEAGLTFYFGDSSIRPGHHLLEATWGEVAPSQGAQQSSTPPDVMVLTHSALKRLSDHTRGLIESCAEDPDSCAGLQNWLIGPQLRRSSRSWRSFCVLDPHATHHADHWRSATSLFDAMGTDSRSRFADWYMDENYPFSIEDVLTFLQQDQRRSGLSDLALVLPGGGVKSAYQARVLDELYTRYLSNSTGTPDTTSNNRLEVRNIVGTSGGAMMSLLAAQDRQPDHQEANPQDSGTPLTTLWRETLSSSGDVFPFFSIPRWVSFFVLVLEFAALLTVLASARSLSLHSRDQQFRTFHTPWRVLLASIVGLVLPPLLLILVWSRGEESRLQAPALCYVATIAIIYLGWGLSFNGTQNGTAPGHSARFAQSVRRMRTLAEIGVWIGTLLVVTIVAAHLPHDWSFLALPRSVTRHSAALLSLGFLLVTLGTFVTHGNSDRRARAEFLLRWHSLICVIGYVAACYLCMAALVMADVTTFLEMTSVFWISLLLIGLLVFGLLACLACIPGLTVGFLRDGLRHLNRSAVRRVIVVTPKTTLLALFGAGLFWWYVCLGSALYSNSKATALFRDLICSGLFEDCATVEAELRPVTLNANLVVTTSALEGFECDDLPDSRYPAGDHYFYFCFDEDARCRSRRADRLWQVHEPRLQVLVDAVFASGSPFPVFPAHKVALTKDCSVPLVDGGYAHLEPIEGAKHVGARQILVIRSQPELETTHHLAGSQDDWFPSQLASFTSRILPFLFRRSQELDRSIASDLVVAQLTPRRREKPFPLLTDFRKKVVERMIEYAEEDLSMPIGRIVSWGPPAAGLRVRAEHATSP